MHNFVYELAFCVSLWRLGDHNETGDPEIFNPEEIQRERKDVKRSASIPGNRQLLLSLNWMQSDDGLQVRTYLILSIHVHVLVLNTSKNINIYKI